MHDYVLFLTLDPQIEPIVKGLPFGNKTHLYQGNGFIAYLLEDVPDARARQFFTDTLDPRIFAVVEVFLG